MTSTSTLVYLTGDSHAAHFLPMVNESALIENLYYTRFASNLLAPLNPKEFDEATLTQALTKRSEQLAHVQSHFDEVVYLSSNYLDGRQKDMQIMEQNLRKYIEAVTPHATFIFIAPTPEYPASTESCVLLRKHCTVDASEEQERRKAVVVLQERLAEEYDRVYVYDPHPAICNEGVCRMYDHERDFLSARDDDHISVEQSRALIPHFESWFRATVIEHEETAAANL